MSVGSVILPVSENKERRSEMNLDEYKAFVLEQRKASLVEAVSVLSATITTKEKEGAN
jgi:hypothetical protein